MVQGDFSIESGVAAGERVRLGIEFDNPLLPGRYFVHLGMNLMGEQRVALYVHNAADFVVYGGEDAAGIVSLPHRVEAEFGEVERR